jgi:hypothetical protein
MTPEGLYKNVVALDRVQHKKLRIRHPFSNYAATAKMNAVFLSALEFGDAQREYPIVFVRAGKDEASGEEQFAPMAVLGVQQGENLYLQAGTGAWRADYVPAFLRRYPFGMAGIGEGQLALCMDRDWDGFSETEGDPLFDEQGQPTELLKNVQQFVENYEAETQRTRLFCAELHKAGLLQDMRFDATMPGGEKLTVDGFLAIDDAKFKALPDAKVVEWHRNGILGLVHAQQLSMGLMRRLVEWRAERLAAAG